MRRFAMLVVSILVLSTIPAWAQKGGFVTATNTNCRLWDDNPAVTGTRTWSGPCVDGLAHGRGVVQYFAGDKTRGNRFEGEMVRGKFNGRGVYLWTSGQRYEGQFRDGDFHGRGVMTWPNGDRYEGEWRNDLAQGLGTKKLPDGRIYTGQWVNGCLRLGERWSTVGRTAEQCGFR